MVWKVEGWQRVEDTEPAHSEYVRDLTVLALVTRTLADIGYAVVRISKA